MKLYLVRWENGDTEIVSARDKVDLFEVLDQVGDPFKAVWRVFKGPVWVSVRADRKTGEICEGVDVGGEPVSGDDRWAMEEAIRETAFPGLHAQMAQELERVGDFGDVDPAVCAQAIQEDLAIFPPKCAGWKSFNDKRALAKIRAAQSRRAGLS